MTPLWGSLAPGACRRLASPTADIGHRHERDWPPPAGRSWGDGLGLKGRVDSVFDAEIRWRFRRRSNSRDGM